MAAIGLALAYAVAAQAPPSVPQALQERSFSLRHQPVREAVVLVFPLLSEDGSVEVRPGGNTLVVRDRPAELERIFSLLADFDQPARSVAVEIRVVSASVEPAAEGEPDGSGLSEELVRRLHELLRYRFYRRVAGVKVTVAEGGSVESALGGEYRVEFRLGRLEPDRRVKLLGFRIHRRAAEEGDEPLIHTNINLRLGKPMVLGLARTESSANALMVVLDCERLGAGDEDRPTGEPPGEE